MIQVDKAVMGLEISAYIMFFAGMLINLPYLVVMLMMNLPTINSVAQLPDN